MAKVRATAPTINLFPFMSILVCLIGTIVVMICVLSIIQATHMGGRPREEVELAMEFVADQKKIEEHKKRLDEAHSVSRIAAKFIRKIMQNKLIKLMDL